MNIKKWTMLIVFTKLNVSRCFDEIIENHDSKTKNATILFWQNWNKRSNSISIEQMLWNDFYDQRYNWNLYI